ncbi:right-handed parallel beta-helix repeat-containing protein [Colwellia sp. 6_MG-2023]|uniref:right-handed parallel beta-helix repeat-containing protein n=1 Tax=Colwellia sp. 6_MG-2023 TaxID=3062676 RepID=UPI0026E1D5D2|nr:right-handed parallel beta-helix repeat-containing protein [Colwellia sp. 6_MG-2023]MDO6487558.1 right-handed parallel beta-helix repeat-containing protein [Colwellia sp. 6_MG-2023]
MYNNIERRHFLKLLGSGLAVAAFSVPLISFAKGLTGKGGWTSKEADFYVAVDGNDDFTGTTAEHRANSKTGPFASVKRARDAVRELKKKQPNKNIVVLIRGGMYQLDETVTFGVEDSAADNFTITYAAFPGEKPVFSSGRHITGWEKAPSNTPGLPANAKGQVWQASIKDGFTTLYDEIGRLPRTRTDGFVTKKKGKKNLISFPEKMFIDWVNPNDAEVIVRPHHAWIVNILPVKSMNKSKRTATTTQDSTYAMNKLHFLPTTENAWIENVIEELNEPGNWVVDTKAGKVYLWPRNNAQAADLNANIVTPELIELFRVEGDIDETGLKDIPVKNLRFNGLTFKHGKRWTVEKDDKGLQHDWDFHDRASALVRFRGTEYCTVEHCHFTDSSSGAIRVDLHGQYNQINNNHIEKLGGAGVLIAGYGPGIKNVSHHNVVYNNHIHHIGEIYNHSQGVLLWQSGENRVANNLIHNLDYIALTISGFMTHFFDKNPKGRELCRTVRRNEIPKAKGRQYTLEEVRPYLHSVNNVLENNELHHVMEKLADGNAIYIRGAGAGNVIRRNYIHNMLGDTAMQAAIRTDGGQMDTLISENVIYKCRSQGIKLKLNNRAENNIIVDILKANHNGKPMPVTFFSLREGPMTGGSLKNNIMYSTAECDFINEQKMNGEKTQDRRGRAPANSKDADTENNIYYCSVNEKLGQDFLIKQQADGVDLNSLATNPLFVDVNNGDLRLNSNSPALKLGFKPIDMTNIGLVI